MALILPNDIANGQLADGERLQQNNDVLETWANQEAITRDGATAMTAPLLLLPGMPTEPNQAANKAYVDAAGASGGPTGKVRFVTKPTTENGFSVTEYKVAGLDFTIPATPTGRLHQVQMSLRTVAASIPVRTDTILIYSLRLGPTVAGAIQDSSLFAFPVNASTYGANLMVMFKLMALTPGQQYIVTAATDGLGIFSILAGSWLSVIDVGANI